MYYFSGEDRRLRYGDGREIAVGVTHTVDCEPVLCLSGLHASERAIDALGYAPGPICWKVELDGDVVHGGGKSVATSRTYISGFDATDVLREFARKCALDVAHLWDAPPAVLEYLISGDEALRIAALEAAGDAARGAAGSAAETAAWAATWTAAETAAGTAAGAAAETAEWGAAWDAARAAQNARLTEALEAHL